MHWRIPLAGDLRRLSDMGPLYPDFMSDSKTRYWKNSGQSCACVEVVCPQPHRVATVPYFIDNISRFSSEPKSILLRTRGETDFDILGVILNKDDMELGGDTDGSNEIGFFCGSPPVRTNNPIIHDAQFTKQKNSVASPLSNPLPVPNPPERTEGASSKRCSSMGGSPKIRVEGFVCGKSDSRCVVPALA